MVKAQRHGHLLGSQSIKTSLTMKRTITLQNLSSNRPRKSRTVLYCESKQPCIPLSNMNYFSVHSNVWWKNLLYMKIITTARTTPFAIYTPLPLVIIASECNSFIYIFLIQFICCDEKTCIYTCCVISHLKL